MLQGIPIKISTEFIARDAPEEFLNSLHVARGTPKDFNWIHCILKGLPLRNFNWMPCIRDTPENLSGNPCILHGQFPRTLMKSFACCKGLPLGFQWNSLHFARARALRILIDLIPCILYGQFRKDFDEILCMLQGPPLWISVEFLALRKGDPLGFQLN